MPPFTTEPQYADGQTVSCQQCGVRLTVELRTSEVTIAVAGELETTALRCTHCEFITCYKCATGSAESFLPTCPSCGTSGGPYFFLKGDGRTTKALRESPAAAGNAALHGEPATRQLRVFVSSTFRDMQAEREVLIKKVFPQVRSLCDQRSVVWSEVDLRWGITDEQLVSGQLLPLCLAEIDRCRPYFIGLLGERYGYVPERIALDVQADRPWLRQHEGRSLTELEMLHAVLNDPALAPEALFYFRDPHYARSVPTERRGDFVSDGDDLDKLASLKERIRAAHRSGQLAIAPRENYATPEALGALVLADLTRLIERVYPAARIPSSVAQERLEQQAFANSHMRAIIARPAYARPLDTYAAGEDSSPLVVVGEAGLGKTALLAEWAEGLRAEHPEWTVLSHFIGGTSDSGDWVEMLRQIMSTIREQLALARDVPFTTSTVREDFPAWLRDATRHRRVVLVIDGLDQLTDRDGALDLTWLPHSLPSNLRLVLATRPGRPLTAIEHRGWGAPHQQVTLAPFTLDERRGAIESFLGLYRKTLSTTLTSVLVDAPQGASPLFLRIVLNELRQFGQHERLAERVAEYLQAVDLTSLFNGVLNRWLADFSGTHDLVKESLCLIGASRRGLSEGEILDVIERDHHSVSRLEWTAFFLAAENALLNRGGRLTFAHSQLAEVVNSRWLDQPSVMHRYRRRLAAFFRDHAALDDRRIDELPWLLLKLEDWDGLRDVLTDVDTFLRMRKSRNRQALMYWWSTLEAHCDPRIALDESLEAWENAEGPRDPAMVSDALNQAGIFHHDRGDFAAAETLFRRSLDILERIPDCDPTQISSRMTNLAQVFCRTGRFDDAEQLMRRELDLTLRSKPRGNAAATCLNNLGRLLQQRNRLQEAEGHLREAVRVWERTEGVNHPKVGIALANLALVFSETGRFGEAERALRRSLDIAEREFGLDDPRLTATLNDFANVMLKQGQPDLAANAIARALKIDEAAHGPYHPDVGRDLCTQGSLLISTGRITEAEPVLSRALRVSERVHGSDHHEVAAVLSNLAILFAATDRTGEADKLIRRAINIDERHLGPDHPAVANEFSTLATTMTAAGRTAEAEQASRRHLEILLACTQRGGYPHPDLQIAVEQYVEALTSSGLRREEAERQVIALASRYDVTLGAKSDAPPPSAPTPIGTTPHTGGSKTPTGGERLRPFQVVLELTEIGKAERFRSTRRDTRFDARGRHLRAHEIGVRLHAQGGVALMRSIFEAVCSRTDAEAASDLEFCWSDIDEW